MPNIQTQESEFELRALDTLIDTFHRQLENIDPKQIKELIEKVSAVEGENVAMQQLKATQGQEYDKLNNTIKESLKTLDQMNLVADTAHAMEIAQKIINKERKLTDEKLKKEQLEKEQQIEPE